MLLQHPALIWVVAGTALALALTARIDHGSLLLTWDEPIQQWVEARRTPALETTFRSFSRLGSNIVIFPSFAVIVLVTARRCRALALALTVAVLVRPAFEFVLKLLVGRDRPDFDRLIDGTGHSFPSGHVLAAVTLWGLLPPLVALATNRRWIWWLATAASGILIIGISASRIYLGVHWFSDIIQGFVLGWLYLTVIETVFVHHHRGRSCSGNRDASHKVLSSE